MVLRVLTSVARKVQILSRSIGQNKVHVRTKITTASGAFLPEPKRVPFSFIQVISAVTIGLVVGAAISKNMASFLEENDLFVPSDDDDDDDDD